ncbi:MAG: hypothetical protein K9J17_01870 [Flavobacteriales bacterium]|nr:hypothetical protein [Flavobacteriales bacterium]
MNGFKSLILLSVLAIASTDSIAQTGVAINATGAAPNSNAILDVTSATKGALLPRMTSAERTAFVPTGLSGMTVFDTTTQSYWYWDGNTNIWKQIPTTTGTSLDAAYDAGGSGLGRTITADAGNVEIQGAGFLTVASNIGVGTTSPDRRMKISGAGWTALEVENTDNQDAAIELTSQSVSNYIFTDNTGYLGLESAAGKEISLRTDGANERMVIQSDGRVRVNNLADANSAVVLSNAAGVLGKRPLTGSTTDVLLGTGAFGPASAFADDDWYQVLSTNTPTGINDWIYTNGRVGIGVGALSNPSSPLEVGASGSGNPDANSIVASNPTNAVSNDAIIMTRVAGSSAGDPFFSMDISGEAGWSMGVDNDHGNRFKVAPSWNNLSSSTALTIKPDGNVGVATDDPNQKLQVNGVIRSNGSYMIDVDAANGAGPRIAWGTTSDVYAMMNLGAYAGINNLETKDRDFRIGSTAVTNAIYLKNADGNVGIGTAGPERKLHVDGDMKIGVDASTLRTLYFGDASYVYLQETADDYLTIEAANGTRIGNQGTYIKDVFHGSFLVGNSNADQCSVCSWDGFGSGHLEIQVLFSTLGIPSGTNKTIMLTVDSGNNTYDDEFAVSLQNFSTDRMDIFIRRIDSSGSTWGLTSMRVNYIIMNNN